MNATFVQILLSGSLFGALLFHEAEAQQIMGGGMQPSPYIERRPTDQTDPNAVYGDRHDPDHDPWLNRGPHMSAPVSNALKSLLAAAGQRDWTTAKSKLLEARAIAHPTEFDLFEIEVVTSFVAINTGDHLTALASYKKAITSPLFTIGQTRPEQVAMLKNAMILSNEAGEFPGAIAFGGKLAEMGPIDDASAIALAVAYFGNKDYAAARNLAQKAIDAAVAGGQKPSDIALKIVAKSNADLH